MGGYGFLRFSLPMFPAASHDFAPLIFALSVIAIVYTSLVALVQEDMKKLIAYSSVAHMGFVTMGIFAVTMQGVAGRASSRCCRHGIVSGALFLCVGVVYDRMHTREIAAYGGLVNRMPLYAAAFMVFTLANVGLPGTSGFVGEFLSLIGAFRVNAGGVFRHARRHPVGQPMRCGFIARSFSGGWRSRRSRIFDLDGARSRLSRRSSRSRCSSASTRRPSSTCRRLPSALIDNYHQAIGTAKSAALDEAKRITMTEFLQTYPILPEVILAVGAMPC